MKLKIEYIPKLVPCKKEEDQDLFYLILEYECGPSKNDHKKDYFDPNLRF
jgi:hypothetical protein